MVIGNGYGWTLFSFAEWLIDFLQALSSNELLAEKATSTVLHLIDQGALYDTKQYSNEALLSSLVKNLRQSGAKADIIKTLGLPTDDVQSISSGKRETRVFRVVSLIDALARLVFPFMRFVELLLTLKTKCTRV